MDVPTVPEALAPDLDALFDASPLAVRVILHLDAAGAQEARVHLEGLSGDLDIAGHADVRQSTEMTARSADVLELAEGDTVELPGGDGAPSFWYAVARRPEHDGAGVATVALGPVSGSPRGTNPNSAFRDA